MISANGVWAVAAIAFAVASPRIGRAGELHSLFDDGCRRHTGVLVHVDEQRVVLVNLEGKTVEQARGTINAIVLHRTLENPLRTIELTGDLRSHLRDVWVAEDARAGFTGWTSAFFDDLFVFVDLEGTTHVLDPQEIQRIDRSEPQAPSAAPRSYAPATLGFPAEVIPCGTATVPDGAVLPSRVIADRIKVGEYLTKLEGRYVDLESFESRTRVYAQPFVFDEENRLGFGYYQSKLASQSLGAQIPIYFRWSNGRPYRFQSSSSLGSTTHEWLPFVEPTFSASSIVKSHFFNAAFIGHVPWIPAGVSPFQSADQLTGLRVEGSYNYVLLMGADFWRLSASAGTSYLATRLSTSLQMDPSTDAFGPAEVLADRASPTLAIRYQDPRLRARALYFHTRQDKARVDDPNPQNAEPGYWFRSDSVRLGATWHGFEGIVISLDQIVSSGRYLENGQQMSRELAYTQLTTCAEVALDFGRYVTVRGHARLHWDRYDLRVPIQLEQSDVRTQFGGALEFLF